MKMDFESVSRIEEGLRQAYAARAPLEPGVEWQRQVMRDIRGAAAVSAVETGVWQFAWASSAAAVVLIAVALYTGMVPDFEVAWMLGGDPSGISAALVAGL